MEVKLTEEEFKEYQCMKDTIESLNKQISLLEKGACVIEKREVNLESGSNYTQYITVTEIKDKSKMFNEILKANNNLSRALLQAVESERELISKVKKLKLF